MIKKLIIIVLLLISALPIFSQEFYCNVKINSRQVEGTEKRVFEDLQSALFEFINNRKWTNFQYENVERIECSILLTITQRVSSDEFKGSLNIALRRPVFNSSYNSIIFNYVDDDFQFKYVLNQPLDFSENTYTSEITSVIAFYLYFMLGLDFDSFVLYGGSPYYEKAEAIVSAAQNSGYPGWKAFEDNNNRYWLVENMLNPRFKPLRKFLYEYHRKGLDKMHDNADAGRSVITQTLTNLKKVHEDRPGLFLIQLLLDAKRDELINIYSEGSPTEKTRAVNILKEIDPSHSSEYQNVLK